MKFLIASDKFKGSIRASEIAAGIVALAPAARVVTVPVADGADGTLDAAVAAGFTPVPVTLAGPTGEPVPTGYAPPGRQGPPGLRADRHRTRPAALHHRPRAAAARPRGADGQRLAELRAHKRMTRRGTAIGDHIRPDSVARPQDRIR